MNKLAASVLKILTDDARTSASAIAAMLGATTAEVKKIINDLENDGTILKYTILTNEELVGADTVQALIEVKVSPMRNRGFDSIAEDIYQFDEVRSVYLMSGAYDLAVTVEASSLKRVAAFVSEKLSVMDKVLSTATHFILKKYKQDGVITSESAVRREAVHP